MEKKGIFIYIGAYLIHNVVALFASNWMIGVLIIPVVGIVLISFCIKRFNWKTNDNKQRNADPGANAPPPVR
jgi:membrane protein DedA with SNARE-associated domain